MLFLTDVGELCEVYLTRPDLGRVGGSPVVEVLEYGVVLAKGPPDYNSRDVAWGCGG